jgi:hypothetical protein
MISGGENIVNRIVTAPCPKRITGFIVLASR